MNTVSVSSEVADLLRAGANVIPLDRVPIPMTNANPGRPDITATPPDPVWVALQQPCPTSECRGGEVSYPEWEGNTEKDPDCYGTGRLWFTITTPCPKCKGNALTGDADGHITSCMGCLGSPGQVPVVEASIVTITGTMSSPVVILNTRPTPTSKENT